MILINKVYILTNLNTFLNWSNNIFKNKLFLKFQRKLRFNINKAEENSFAEFEY